MTTQRDSKVLGSIPHTKKAGPKPKPSKCFLAKSRNLLCYQQVPTMIVSMEKQCFNDHDLYTHILN